ncbi:hypothetical protein C0J52_00666 [Blattella germanica]|nr:hypothetical protein C0J52_00666 [Blattella germanica]
MDIAVVSTEELDKTIAGQIDFFNTKNNDSLLGQPLKPYADLQALAYDPIRQQLFLSDDNHQNYSIFTVSLQGNSVLTPFIKRTDNHTVRDIAYDMETDTLYWTSETAIYWYNKSMKRKEGEILIQLDKKDIPHGIAIDRCRRYLYWTNRYHIRPTIERSLLNGTKKEVIVNKNLFRPMGLAVDELAGKIYWSDDKEGIYYDIRRADLDGNNTEIIHSSEYHDPVDLAIGPHEIYWSDIVHRAVWKISKDSYANDEPTKIYQYKERSPQGIIAWTDSQLDCEPKPVTKTTAKPSTTLALSDEPITASESSVREMSNYCLNSGILVPGRISRQVCHCPIGYAGKRCEVDICYNYCLNNGQCEVDRSGRPTCVCQYGTSGPRCEQDVCSDYCLNGAKCTINNEGKPSCECKGLYIGDRCEELADSEKLCKLYCQQFLIKKCLSIRCPSTELLKPENSSFPSGADYVTSAGLIQSCTYEKSVSHWVSIALGAACMVLMTAIFILVRKVFVLKKRPRIKKRIIVNKNFPEIGFIGSCFIETKKEVFSDFYVRFAISFFFMNPHTNDETFLNRIFACIRHCLQHKNNTRVSHRQQSTNKHFNKPCFEPQLRTPKSSRREEKKTLLGSMEETPTSSPCQDDLY